jgi:cyclopropane fatty-acyl-phospholipid synthase-like methyltransferase
VTDAAAAVARRAYASESFGTRLHTALRWRTCPFREVAEEVPRRGEILDAGCGHGLLSVYLAAQAPERRVTGVDIDEEKLAVARRAADAARVDGRVRFQHITSEWKPDARWDAIVEVDMLYLLGRERAADWVHTASQALEPGGRLVVKELDVTPTWKAQWSRFQEVLATRVMRITEGEELELIPRVDVVGAMDDGGLSVTTRRLDRGRLHPHYVAVGTRDDF